jgi:threonine dehydrogenase-like Zn-dependent dehydrogenase
MPGMRPGTILGHEAVGVVEQTGPQVRNFVPGDRVVIPLDDRLRQLRVQPGRLLLPVR